MKWWSLLPHVLRIVPFAVIACVTCNQSAPGREGANECPRCIGVTHKSMMLQALVVCGSVKPLSLHGMMMELWEDGRGEVRGDQVRREARVGRRDGQGADFEKSAHLLFIW